MRPKVLASLIQWPSVRTACFWEGGKRRRRRRMSSHPPAPCPARHWGQKGLCGWEVVSAKRAQWGEIFSTEAKRDTVKDENLGKGRPQGLSTLNSNCTLAPKPGSSQETEPPDGRTPKGTTSYTTTSLASTFHVPPGASSFHPPNTLLFLYSEHHFLGDAFIWRAVIKCSSAPFLLSSPRAGSPLTTRSFSNPCPPLSLPLPLSLRKSIILRPSLLLPACNSRICTTLKPHPTFPVACFSKGNFSTSP